MPPAPVGMPPAGARRTRTTASTTATGTSRSCWALLVTTDYRSVLAEVVSTWFDVSTATVVT